jgi:ATP-dependent Clp protease protease subunit
MRRNFDLRALAAVANRGEARQWYTISNATEESAEVYIYDVIGEFWGFGLSAATFAQDIRNISAKKATLRLNSPGGLIDEAVAMRSAWDGLKAEKTTIVDGIAASSASFVGLGNPVLMAKGSRVMIHEAWSGMLGNKRDFRHEAGVLEQYDNDIADFYVAKAGGDRSSWLARMETETWIPASEAIALGLADGMTDESKAENRYDPVFLNIFANTPADLRARPRDSNERLGKREAEKALRDGGMSAADAKALVSRGWDALDPRQAAIRSLTDQLKSYV